MESLNVMFQKSFFAFLKIFFSKSKWQGLLSQDTSHLITVQFSVCLFLGVMFFFHILLLCVTSRGRLVVAKIVSGCLPKDTEDGGTLEGTDGRRYCGTQCLGKLMNGFPPSIAQRPLRIASCLTFTSQLVYRNHHTHHEGLPPPKAPSQARCQTSGSVYVTLLITSLKVCLVLLFL